MTTLHYILIGLAVILVGGLAVYNLIQERRLRKQVDRMFAQQRDDIPLGDVGVPESYEDSTAASPIRLQADDDSMLGQVAQSVDWGEPKLALDELDDVAMQSPSPRASTVDVAPVAKAPVSAPARIELEMPPLQASIEARSAGDATAASRRTTEMLDPKVEYVARLRFTQPAYTAFAQLLDHLRRIGKVVRAVGQRDDGVWEALSPHPATAYPVVEVAIQLADRNGPLSEPQLDAFCHALYGFATEHGGAVSCPDKMMALEQARALDQFCIEVDALIGLNIVSPDSAPFDGEDIHRIASDAGMQLGPDGSYLLRDMAGHTLFSLVNQEATPFSVGGRGLTSHGITLLFDLPRVENGLVVFDRMTRLGFDLAARLPGHLVDDSGRAVTQDSLQKDRQRLDAFYAKMTDHGIPAGSERALRLFA